MKAIVFFLIPLLLLGCRSIKGDVASTPADRTENFPKSVEIVDRVPPKEKVWVFIMAGQSNMAGRGFVEPQDTIPSQRVLTINRNGQLVYAKEPLHFYEPTMTGLDCGLSFGKTLVKSIPNDVSVLLIPTAVGGSSISDWLKDSVYRNVRLLTNFREKVDIANRYGQIKGILWHQGESDAHPGTLSKYRERLTQLFSEFRTKIGRPTLPILIGQLGTYSENPNEWKALNEEVIKYTATDPNTAIISTSDFKHKGDKIHFNSQGQRTMGKRFAQAYLSKFR